MTDQMVDYWALGGRAERETLGTSQRVIHYAGSPQGRSPDERGPHGCTLVQVAADRAIRTQFIPTDVIRWQTEELTVEPEATLESVRQVLAERVKHIKAAAESRIQIVTWQIRGGEHLAGPAARRELASEWQAWLRNEFFLSGGKPALWTHAVELDQPELPQAWQEEESMLGDFLRNLRELAELEPNSIDIGEDVPDQHRMDPFRELGEWNEEEHQSVLYEAALVGAQLLGAGEREPEA